MATVTQAAAVSHVGKVRSNNQDSGYAGRDLFVVADGMGGHAGGDVASAVALTRIIEADKPYASAHDAEFALQAGLVAANQLLAETVFEHSELTGMGTTVSALARVGRHVAIAHIGDSRIYLFRRGELSQISADHTFVQRLVDSGRITPEEALVHPRRSVLMRVLGDVDAAPEVDTQVLDTHTGDRWLLCSDGLSSYVSEERITEILATAGTPDTVADALVKESLDHGAPDNVTVVVVDVLDEDDETAASRPAPEPVVVGSASQPLAFGTSRRSAPCASRRSCCTAARHHGRARRAVRAGVGPVPRGPHRGGQAPRPPPPRDLAGGRHADRRGTRPRVRPRLPLDPVPLLRGRVRRGRRGLQRRAADHRADRALARLRAHRGAGRRPPALLPPAGGADHQRRLARGAEEIVNRLQEAAGG
ncbi:PP2C-family Ser/Thr phosphatase [Clavibacter michiganensis subsp. michiganensis]|uniref:PP2C-family Ser/Thr phosphatase n=1 Tax=Clavibacter michiganensis subsp. michiganensis TaxID=33013 RepID=A0A251XLW8_CLAMM|nr:PP2C-family Ser/Thr phosphatase [Clavibacter michiganensis subsp. michiganensis]OUE04467.1 PP2C-family Ser/Thr phosphatase [Clavibacter michiganensis subsp. michiganensis]